MKSLSNLIFLIALLNSNYSYSFSWCSTPEIDISFKVDYGKATYKRVPNDYIVKKSNNHIHTHQTVRGLTEASYSDSMDTSYSISQEDGTVCIYPSAVKVYLGYTELNVFVDNKYSINSCEYKTTLGHENQHVKIYQSGVKKYAKDISKRIYDLIQTVEPLEFKVTHSINKNDSAKYVKQMNQNINLILEKDDKLRQIKKNMNDYIVGFNSALDSPKNYRETQNRCSNW